MSNKFVKLRVETPSTAQFPCQSTVFLCTVQWMLQTDNGSNRQRVRAAAKLAAALLSGKAGGLPKCQVQLPAEKDHSNHVVGEVIISSSSLFV